MQRKLIWFGTHVTDRPRILIIQLRRIGDVLMCTPAVRALRRSFPEGYIAFLVEGECSDLLMHNPHLDQVLVLDRRKYKNPLYWLQTIRRIRRERFDVAIDFLGNPRSTYICFLSGAERRAGYDIPVRRWFYNMIATEDPTARYSAAHKLGVLKLLGVESSDVQLDFFVSAEARLFSERFFRENRIDSGSLIVCISPTSRRRFRRWPLDRFARLADWLTSQFGARVILVWGPGEKHVVEKVRDQMKRKPVVCWETKNLLELGAILEKCDLYLGNDNGTKHIAVAMGKPTVTIYGPEDPRSWTYPDKSRHRFLKAQVECTDCRQVKHKCVELDCLHRITVGDVQRVFLELIKDLRRGQEKGLARKVEHLAAD